MLYWRRMVLVFDIIVIYSALTIGTSFLKIMPSAPSFVRSYEFSEHVPSGSEGKQYTSKKTLCWRKSHKKPDSFYFRTAARYPISRGQAQNGTTILLPSTLPTSPWFHSMLYFCGIGPHINSLWKRFWTFTTALHRNHRLWRTTSFGYFNSSLRKTR